MELIEEMEEIRETEAPTATEPEPSEKRRVPLPPESLEDAGLSEELVAGLLLKTLHVRGATLGFELSDALALPMALLDEVLVRLQERRFLEVRGTSGPGRGEFVFGLTGAGRARALEELEVSRYVGPAPVPFEDFRRWVELQSIEDVQVSAEGIEEALEGVVVSREFLDLLGPAVNSGRSLFLHGDAGNGKTLLAERIARAFGDEYFVPHAVLVDGSVMVVHDPVHHAPPTGERTEVPEPPPSDAGGEERPESGEAASDELPRSGITDGLPDELTRSGAEEPNPGGEAPTWLTGTAAEIVRPLPEHDRRFARARRPVVVTGGELTLDQLDLRWDPIGRTYQAPPQVKAAGGVLVIDDLGRQRVEPRELLNRWIVPLEKRRDYLTLRSGKKLVVAFDCLVIFSTNLDPALLADEAFLRRIQYKIRVPEPDSAQYRQIFESCCAARDIEFRDEALTYLFDELYGRLDVPLRACHPRDILDHLCDLARYRGEAPELREDLLEQAWRSYFVSVA